LKENAAGSKTAYKRIKGWAYHEKEQEKGKKKKS